MKEEPRFCADEKGAARRPTGNKSTERAGWKEEERLPSDRRDQVCADREGKNKIDARVEAWTGRRGGRGEGKREREKERDPIISRIFDFLALNPLGHLSILYGPMTCYTIIP